MVKYQFDENQTNNKDNNLIEIKYDLCSEFVKAVCFINNSLFN